MKSKEAQKLRSRAHYLKNREKILEKRREENKTPQQKEYKRNYLKKYLDPENPAFEYRKEKSKISKRKWYDKNKNHVSTKAKEFRDKPENRKKHAKFQKEKRQKDVQFGLKIRLRSRVRGIIKGKSSRIAIDFLGCDLSFFKIYIESQFEDWMTWENWGKIETGGERKWNLDHIIPLAAFDLTDDEEIKRACHYTNLRPLCALKNIQKGAKVLDT